MRRSWMPVRRTIHSLSTPSGVPISALGMIRSGSAMPIPSTPALRSPSEPAAR